MNADGEPWRAGKRGSFGRFGHSGFPPTAFVAYECLVLCGCILRARAHTCVIFCFTACQRKTTETRLRYLECTMTVFLLFCWKSEQDDVAVFISPSEWNGSLILRICTPLRARGGLFVNSTVSSPASAPHVSPARISLGRAHVDPSYTRRCFCGSCESSTSRWARERKVFHLSAYWTFLVSVRVFTPSLTCLLEQRRGQKRALSRRWLMAANLLYCVRCYCVAPFACGCPFCHRSRPLVAGRLLWLQAAAASAVS